MLLTVSECGIERVGLQMHRGASAPIFMPRNDDGSTTCGGFNSMQYVDFKFLRFTLRPILNPTPFHSQATIPIHLITLLLPRSALIGATTLPDSRFRLLHLHAPDFFLNGGRERDTAVRSGVHAKESRKGR